LRCTAAPSCCTGADNMACGTPSTVNATRGCSSNRPSISTDVGPRVCCMIHTAQGNLCGAATRLSPCRLLQCCAAGRHGVDPTCPAVANMMYSCVTLPSPAPTPTHRCRVTPLNWELLPSGPRRDLATSRSNVSRAGICVCGRGTGGGGGEGWRRHTPSTRPTGDKAGECAGQLS
jgi:hypothetical protein